MHRLIFGFSILLGISFLSCENKKNQTKVRGPEETPAEKPFNQIPPNFSSAQIKVGNSMTWLKVSPGNKKTCIQWTFTQTSKDSASFVIQKSQDCQTFSTIIDIVKMDLSNFKIINHQRFDDKEVLPIPKEESLLNKYLTTQFLITENKLKYFVGSGNLKNSGTNKFPWLKIESNSFIYYNDIVDNKPHPWHGTLIKFVDPSNSRDQYFYWNSVPPLSTIP